MGKPLTYDVAHSDGFILIDREGHERFVTVQAPNLDGHLKSSLKGLLGTGGLNGLVHPTAQTWTVTDGLDYLGWLMGTNISANS